jgi:hypothetical protein
MTTGVDSNQGEFSHTFYATPLGLSFCPSSDNSGVVVSEVYSADATGICTGDQVVSINGALTHSWTLTQVVQRLSAGDLPLTLGFRRSSGAVPAAESQLSKNYMMREKNIEEAAARNQQEVADLSMSMSNVVSSQQLEQTLSQAHTDNITFTHQFTERPLGIGIQPLIDVSGREGMAVVSTVATWLNPLISPGDMIVAIGGEVVRDWTCTQVAAKLSEGVVPVDITFQRTPETMMAAAAGSAPTADLDLAPKPKMSRLSSTRTIQQALFRQTDSLRSELLISEQISFCGLVLLVVCSVVPAMLGVLCFSSMGFGEDVYKFLIDNYEWSGILIGGGQGILFLLYLFDFSYWHGPAVAYRQLLGLAVGCALLIGFILSAKDHPGLPLCFFLLFNVPWLYFVKQQVYPQVHISTFFVNLSAALLFTSVVIGFWWFAWWWVNDIFWDNARWTDLASNIGCTDENCLAAYLLYFAPELIAVSQLVFAALSYFLGNSLRKVSSRFVALKVFAVMLSLCFVAMWTAASIASADMQLSNALNTFMLVMLVVLAGVIGGTVGWKSMQESILQIPVVKTITATFTSDWLKALLVLAFLPFFCMYLCLSVCNQIVRVRLGYFSCSKSLTKPVLTKEEKNRWVTQIAHNQLTVIGSWRWASVLEKVMWCGILLVAFVVGVGKLVTLFLSCLVKTLAPLSLGLVCFIFLMVGLIMFLLPPVPGVPVYLTAGIIIVANAEPTMGFWPATLFASIIGILSKIPLAFTIQWGVLGKQLGTSVAVRSLVGVNSVSIRAIQKILTHKPTAKEPQTYFWAKLCILCGGPDWPTAVLTGILGCSLKEMTLYSLPVYFVVAPCTVAGALLLREGEVWEAASSVALAISAAIQVMAMLAALYHIEEVAANNYDELKRMPDDLEVLEREQASAAAKRRFDAFTDWRKSTFPVLMRGVLVAGAFTAMGATWLTMLMPEECFEPFTVNDNISAPPLNGKVSNIVKPIGWYAVYLFLVAIGFLFIFMCWTRDSNIPKDIEVEEEEEDGNDAETSRGMVSSNITGNRSAAAANVSSIAPADYGYHMDQGLAGAMGQGLGQTVGRFSAPATPIRGPTADMAGMGNGMNMTNNMGVTGTPPVPFGALAYHKASPAAAGVGHSSGNGYGYPQTSAVV